MTCINKKSVEYQTLKDKSGIPEYILDATCAIFLNKYDRFPYLDEIVGSNSENYLKRQLDIKNNNSVNLDNLLKVTNSETIEQSIHKLNDQYRDLQINILPVINEGIVEIKHMPTQNNNNVQKISQDNLINSPLIFKDIILKLSKLYGINFNFVTDYELNSKKWEHINPNVKAFVYNNEIYININKYSIDSPIHELMHLFIGSIRFSNPNLYTELINSVTNFQNYNSLSKQFVNRTKNDINEEIFVTEVSKYLTGLDSEINQFNDKIKYELNYNIKRLLDIILFGQDSVKIIEDFDFYNLSLRKLSELVNSQEFVNGFKGFFSSENSELHRKLNNMKSQLYKEGILKEYC